MTAQIVTLTDSTGAAYLDDQLTMNFSDGRSVVREYGNLCPDSMSVLTPCGTVRFTAGMDMETPSDPSNIATTLGVALTGETADLMSGARFDNMVITKATATVLPEMLDATNYSLLPVIDTAGDYDILNSDGISNATYQTILWNPATITYNYQTAGQDVCSFDFNPSASNPALSSRMSGLATALQTTMQAVPSSGTFDPTVQTDEDALTAAVTAYNAAKASQYTISTYFTNGPASNLNTFNALYSNIAACVTAYNTQYPDATLTLNASYTPAS
jgi:hypothetical protein